MCWINGTIKLQGGNLKTLFLGLVAVGCLLFTRPASAQFTSASAIDCSRYPGAPDMGAQINNCLAAGPATGAVYDTTHFVSPQMISTPIVMNKPGVILSCAITIFQKAGITLRANTASWTGCPDKSTVLVKSANITQFTVTSTYNTISNLDLEGGKSQYSGNGIVLDNSGGRQQQAQIVDNLIEGHRNDGILNSGGAYNQIQRNTIQNYGAHAIELSDPQFVTISENSIMGFGDETSSTIFAHGNCQTTIIGNPLIENAAGFPAIDGSGCLSLKITSNTQIYSPTGIAVKTAGPGEVSDNYIAGRTALEVLGGGGTAQKNTLLGFGGDVVLLNRANQYIISGNIIDLIDNVGGACGINITGDTLGVQAINNTVNLTSNGTDDYGACLTLTETHMLNNLIDGLSVDGFLHGDYSFYFNNSAGKNTNILNTIRNVSCVHVTACYKRVDPANNVTVYEDALTGDTALDAGTGSTQDIFIQPKMRFAELPAIAGNGSHTYCPDCTPGAPVKGNGTGSMIFRVEGVWKGI
jgi:hypothetical protein